jgi:predicted ATPase/DNA-binding winged helix-turn-helix (wHTH) protein
MNTAWEPQTIVDFGRFAIVPHRRELLIDGRPAKLGARAFDILMALVEQRGVVVTKDALMRRVWHDTIVEENSLARQIAALRKALADEPDIIRTVSGRGYLFTAAVQVRSEEDPGRMASPDIRLAHETDEPSNLPQPASLMFGREAEQSELLDLLQSSRLVTLTGPGGTGKTRLALAVAHQLRAEFQDGVQFVELASLSDPDMVPVAVALACSMKFSSGGVSAERVARALGSRCLLIVLDNCEHLAGAAAEMAEALLRCAPSVRVMATSREPLKAEGECIYRVRPLAVPDESVTDMAELLGHASVELFAARVRALDAAFSPDAAAVSTIGALCRRLDGIPLAIELAAARAAGLGIEELAKRIEDRFRLLVDGRRKALPRHRTLQATLDWSYDLLPGPERAVLRRLAAFAGGFTLAAAGSVAASDTMIEPDVVSAVVNLVAKSLVVMETDGARPSGKVRYRLLETTRAYALEKLVAAGEFDGTARRHAEYYRDFCLAEIGPSMPWLFKTLDEACRQEIGNIRAALDWAFSPHGDGAIAVSLAIASFPLWLQISLIDECRRYVERALASPAARSDRKLEFGLVSALALTQMGRDGSTLGATKTLERGLKLAESLDDAAYRLQAISGQWAYHVMRGNCRAALPLAQKLQSGAASSLGDLLAGITLHFKGEQAEARALLEPHADVSGPTAAALARVLWLQGCPEQAMVVISKTLERANAAERVDWLCATLGVAACPIALLAGDLDMFERHIRAFTALAERHYFDSWRVLARCFDAILQMKRANLANGLGALRSCRDELGLLTSGRDILAVELAHGLGMADRIAEGLEVIDSALELSEHNEERWCVPELLHVRGQLLLRAGPSQDPRLAEALFRKSLDIARQQDALFWERRTAASLASLPQDQNGAVEVDAPLRAAGAQK